MREKSLKFSKSVKVWGSMFATGMGNICFLKRSINTAVYRDVLDNFFIPYIEDKCGNNESISQHDMVSFHSVKSAK